MKARSKRPLFIGALTLTIAVTVWAVFSLRDDTSILSIFVRYEESRMGGSADTFYGVMVRMSWYVKLRRYDDAVRVGNAWATRNPNDESSVRIYMLISGLYLRRAQLDKTHADEYVSRAMLYRDKMLPLDSNTVYGLCELAALSEAGGDLSEVQRCVQYRNTIRFWDHLTKMLREQRAVAPREGAFTVPRKGTSAEYVLTVEDIDSILERTWKATAEVQGKMQKSGCAER